MPSNPPSESIIERLTTVLERLADHLDASARPTLPALLSVEQAAEALSVSAAFVYRLVRAEKLPAIRIGRAIKFRRDDLEKYQGTRKPRKPATDLRLLR